MTARVIVLDGTHPLSREEVGGKAFSINDMRRLGLPVPPAFVLPTRECAAFHDAGSILTDEVWAEVVAALRGIEEHTGRRFGQGPSPLLVSVRSGAAESMPGMMDTVLNLGLNADLAAALAVESGDSAWADDTWHRFRESYGSIVSGDPAADPPTDPHDQLREAIGAVFRSWDSPRAVAYRERHGLTALGGTAVTVQAMVFGNRDDDSGTGVLFTRDASTGEPVVTGDWLARAQGEEVVSGSRTPLTFETLGAQHPELHRELRRVAAVVEDELDDMADIEFTVESGRLYVLQSRVGKRSPLAAVRIAVDLVREGRIDRATALGRISREHAARLIEADAGCGTDHASSPVLAEGAGIGTGVATGVAVADIDEAEERAAAGEDVVLVRAMTAPEDVPAMFQSVAVVTEIGGPTSHAALVCREIGLPCVVGCGDGTIEALLGRIVTVDGTSGRVYELGQSGEPRGRGERDGEGRGAGRDPYLAELLSFVEGSLPDDHPLAPLLARDSVGAPA